MATNVTMLSLRGGHFCEYEVLSENHKIVMWLWLFKSVTPSVMTKRSVGLEEERKVSRNKTFGKTKARSIFSLRSVYTVYRVEVNVWFALSMTTHCYFGRRVVIRVPGRRTQASRMFFNDSLCLGCHLGLLITYWCEHNRSRPCNSIWGAWPNRL